MRIFKDLFTGSEIGSDSYKNIKLVDDLYYEIDGKREARSMGIDESKIGANPSAEDEGAGGDLEEGVVKGIDVIMNHNLMELTFDKKSFMGHSKKYMKKLVSAVEEKEGKEKADELKTKLNDMFTKKIIPNFKDFDCYVGENFDEEGMIILMNYRDDGITPYFIYFKDGIEMEKV